MSDRSSLYAEAFLSLIRAEGSGNEVIDELFRVSRSIEGNDELRNTLSDPKIDAAVRTQIVQDLLENKAHPLTVSIVSTVVTTGVSTVVSTDVSTGVTTGVTTVVTTCVSGDIF